MSRYYPLIEMDFDKKELVSKMTLKRAVANGSAELLVAYDDETKIDLAYALVFVKSMYKYVLLKYFGVFPWYRESGVGSDALRLVIQRYAESSGIIAEIPIFEDNDEQQINSIKKIFTRFGFEKTVCDEKIGGAPGELLVKQIKASGDVSKVIHRVLNDFYSRILPLSSSMVEIHRADTGNQ